MRANYLHSGDNSRDNRHYYSHANQNLLLKWTLTRIRATIIPAIIVAIIAGIIAGIMVLLPAIVYNQRVNFSMFITVLA